MKGPQMGTMIIKLTSKRQATFPRAVCDQMGIASGDGLRVEKRIVDGEAVWVLRPVNRDTSWLGSLRKFAEGKSHRMASVRASIAKGLKRK